MGAGGRTRLKTIPIVMVGLGADPVEVEYG